MKIGICTAPETAAGLPADACDFYEANVQTFLVPEKDEREFAALLDSARSLPTPIKAACCFLPGDLKCVGPHVDYERLLRYVETAFVRAEQAGIEVVVFGSGVSRTVPAGHAMEHVMTEFVSLLRLLGPIAGRHGLMIAVEPLNKSECNFITSLKEGAEAVERCNHPNVRLLADTYHMIRENEPADEIAKFGALLVHMHVSELSGRFYPGKAREDHGEFYRALKQAGYTGRISIECHWDDIRVDAAPSVQFLREQLADAGL